MKPCARWTRSIFPAALALTAALAGVAAAQQPPAAGGQKKQAQGPDAWPKKIPFGEATLVC